MAWLDAKPDGPRPGRRKGQPEEVKITRRQMWEKKGLAVTMPPVEVYQHIVGWFHEIGPVAPGVLGNHPVSYQEMAAWAGMTGVEIDYWEAGAIKKMSEQYCYQSYISDSVKCPAPYMMAVDDTGLAEMRKTADAKLRSMW